MSPRPEPDPRRRAFWLLCASALGGFMAQGLFFPALPLYLTRELGASKALSGLIMSSTSLAALAARPWAGRSIDLRGRKPVLIGGTAATMISGLGMLAAHTLPSVLALRILQGFGYAVTYSACAAVAADLAPPERRATYLARFSLFFYFGFALGPAAAEALIAWSGYAAVWWAVAAGCAAGAALALLLPETRPIYTTPPAPLPLMKRLFHPAAMAPGLVLFTLAVPWTATSAFLVLYAREVGLGGSQGLFITTSVMVVLTRGLAGGAADRYGRRAVAAPAAALISLALVVLAVFQSPVGAYVGMAIFGAGFSGMFPPLLALVVDRAPEAERGAAMTSFNVYYDIGAPFGGYGVGLLIDRAGFGVGFGAIAGLAALGALALTLGYGGVRAESGRRAPVRA